MPNTTTAENLLSLADDCEQRAAASSDAPGVSVTRAMFLAQARTYRDAAATLVDFVKKHPPAPAIAPPASASPFTWEATAYVTPIRHRGTMEDCRAWCEAMIGRDLVVIDADGNPHAVGKVTRTAATSLR